MQETALEVPKAEETPAEKAKRQKSAQKDLVQSPMFQFSAYPTPSGTVLRSRSPPGGSRTITAARDTKATERPATAAAISFDPPFNPVSKKYLLISSLPLPFKQQPLIPRICN